jgi:hypothetical protein
MKSKIIIILVIVFLLFISSFKLIIFVNDDGKINSSGIKIYVTKQGFDSCWINRGNEIAHTNRFGFVLIRPGSRICEVVFTKDNMILAGEDFGSFGGVNPFIIVKSSNFNERPVALTFSHTDYEQKMDLLSLINNINYNNPHKSQIDILAPDIKNEEYDFTLYQKMVMNDALYPTLMPVYTGSRKIIFTENGGIQTLDKIVNEGDYLFVNGLNIDSVPKDGYKKELEIFPGKMYAVRLRDGKHYAVLTTHGSTWGNMEFLIQPTEKNSFNFIKQSEYFLKWVSFN